MTFDDAIPALEWFQIPQHAWLIKQPLILNHFIISSRIQHFSIASNMHSKEHFYPLSFTKVKIETWRRLLHRSQGLWTPGHKAPLFIKRQLILTDCFHDVIKTVSYCLQKGKSLFPLIDNYKKWTNQRSLTVSTKEYPIAAIWKF